VLSLFDLGLAAHFTSPRLRGEVEFERRSNSGEGDSPRIELSPSLRKQPLTPTLSP